MTTPVNSAGRLDRLPMGAFQWRILSLIGLGMFFDGFDKQMAAGVLGALVKEGWSNMETNAHYISITFAGLAVGALMTGLVGDRYGRRFAYQFNLLIFGSMCLFSMLAPSMTWLMALRFFLFGVQMDEQIARAHLGTRLKGEFRYDPGQIGAHGYSIDRSKAAHTIHRWLPIRLLGDFRCHSCRRRVEGARL